MTTRRSTSEDDTLDAGTTDTDDPATTDTDDPLDGADPGRPTAAQPAGEPEQQGRSWGKVGIAIALVVAVVLGGFRIISLTSERDDLTDQVAALEESLRLARGDLGGQIEQLEDDNAELTEQTERLQALFTDAVTDLSEALAEIDLLTEQLAERRTEIDELTEQLAELQAIVDITGTDITLMPDLLGTPIEEVRELADELGLELIELELAPGNVIARPGDVIEQLPLEETPLLRGSVIWVEVFTPPLEPTDE